MIVGNRTTPKELDARGRHRLAEALGDTPETVISIHFLHRGLCRAYVSGGPEHFAALIQSIEAPGEPTAFGEDARALWKILHLTSDWWCVNVPDSLAPGLAAIMESEQLRCSARLYGDVHHTQVRPVPPAENPDVRLLTPEDLPLVEAAPAVVRGTGFENPRTLLHEGIVAGALLSSGLAAIAFTSALTDRYADISVATLEGWHGRGFATAAASLVVRRVQRSGRVPVWSAGEDNYASLQVARKLGFVERFRRTYVIPERR
ncbi:MAG: GNAT family N-acetyltransferase [Rubrobacter sp.]|nr:GNAT family N-acetyltransferase [Rubrobacter sp.]